MIFYHSGDGSSYSQPEIMLGDKATLMLTFWNQRKGKPNRRLSNILKARKRRRKMK